MNDIEFEALLEEAFMAGYNDAAGDIYLETSKATKALKNKLLGKSFEFLPEDEQKRMGRMMQKDQTRKELYKDPLLASRAKVRGLKDARRGGLAGGLTQRRVEKNLNPLLNSKFGPDELARYRYKKQYMAVLNRAAKERQAKEAPNTNSNIRIAYN